MVGGELKEMYLCVGEALPGVEGQRDCRREGGLAVRAACEDNVYAPVPLDLESQWPDLAPGRLHGQESEEHRGDGDDEDVAEEEAQRAAPLSRPERRRRSAGPA